MKPTIINLETYSSPTTYVIHVAPARCIAGSDGSSKLQSMGTNEIVDEDF